jgi:hypothetical protein
VEGAELYYPEEVSDGDRVIKPDFKTARRVINGALFCSPLPSALFPRFRRRRGRFREYDESVYRATFNVSVFIAGQVFEISLLDCPLGSRLIICLFLLFHDLIHLLSIVLQEIRGQVTR